MIARALTLPDVVLEVELLLVLLEGEHLVHEPAAVVIGVMSVTSVMSAAQLVAVVVMQMRAIRHRGGSGHSSAIPAAL